MSFFQTATENLQSVNVVRHLRPCKTNQQDSMGMERFWNLQRSKFINHNVPTWLTYGM